MKILDLHKLGCALGQHVFYARLRQDFKNKNYEKRACLSCNLTQWSCTDNNDYINNIWYGIEKIGDQ